MRIIAEGVVFSSLPGDVFPSNAFPLPCVGDSGRWFCAFRSAPTKAGTRGQRTLMTWSDDHGRSWSAPIEPFKPVTVEGKPGLIRGAGLTALGGKRLLAALCWVDHSAPDLPFFNEETEGLLDTRILLSRSDDDGLTWSEPALMDTSPFNMPTPLTGPILRLPGGELACQFELNKHYYDVRPWRHASVMMFSRDGGETWPEHTIAAQDPEMRVFYWDQRPSVLPGGRLLNLFWTFDRRDAAYLNIHTRESSDNGRKWSPLWDTGVPGQPGPVFPLSDGAIAMPYVDRAGAPKIRLRRSDDGGRSWPDGGEVTVYDSTGPSQTERKSSMQDAWSEMAKFSVGLPNTAALPGSGALLVYYAGRATDNTDVRWAVIS